MAGRHCLRWARRRPGYRAGTPFASDWVANIEQELSKKEYRYLLANVPRTPQASVLRLLNQPLERKPRIMIALDVLPDGVRRYYSEQDVAPLITHIGEHISITLS